MEIKFKAFYKGKIWNVESIDFGHNGIDLRDEQGKGIFVDGIENVDLIQYTNLIDMNGKEAYHKDLISAGGYSNWIIEWHKDGWYMKTTDIDEKHYHAIPDDFIIFGNQFENEGANNGK